MWSRSTRYRPPHLSRLRRPSVPLLRPLFSAATVTAGSTTLIESTPPLFSISPPPVNNDKKPVDERTLKLGKTIRILQDRMPTLLHSPLPSEILSPNISLHLFPTTHPDLPVVRGRVAYIAALWTAPIAWGKLPGRGTTLTIISERMLPDEKLKVRWRAGAEDEFAGIFLFGFDAGGRIEKHVIENTEEDDGGEKTSSVITVTEWLIRKARGGGGLRDQQGEGGLAWQFTRR